MYIAFDESYSWSKKSLTVIAFSSRIIPVNALALFCTLAHMISLHLEDISNEIQDMYVHCASDKFPIKLEWLALLKKQHFLVYKAVRQLNHSFGFYLLIEVIYNMTGATNNSMFLVEYGKTKDWNVFLICIFGIFDYWFRFLLITSSADKIDSKVKRC